jgi:hypothetical protein
LPYGIPGPSQVSGSQEEPIILSSDEDIKIKTEKVTAKKAAAPVESSSPEKAVSVRKKNVSKCFISFIGFL